MSPSFSPEASSLALCRGPRGLLALAGSSLPLGAVGPRIEVDRQAERGAYSHDQTRGGTVATIRMCWESRPPAPGSRRTQCLGPDPRGAHTLGLSGRTSLAPPLCLLLMKNPSSQFFKWSYSFSPFILYFCDQLTGLWEAFEDVFSEHCPYPPPTEAVGSTTVGPVRELVRGLSRGWQDPV